LEAAVRVRLAQASQRSSSAQTRLVPATRAIGERLGQRVAVLKAHLDGKDPEAILQRGYAIVEYDGAIVRDAASVPPGARIAARLARGTLAARVEPEGTHGN
jgi:exodeoxyribonuclease VII large subunit